MAARKPTTPADAPFDFSTVKARVASALPVTSAFNPLLEVATDSLNQGVPLEMTIPASAVEAAQNNVRRAAKTLDLQYGDVGSKIRVTPVAGTQDVVFFFQLSHGKRNVRYTQDEVRAWALLNGYSKEDLHPRVPRSVSKEYRIANGFQTAETD